MPLKSTGVVRTTIQNQKGSLEEPNDLEILASQITKVVHYYSTDRLEVEVGGWMKEQNDEKWMRR